MTIIEETKQRLMDLSRREFNKAWSFAVEWYGNLDEDYEYENTLSDENPEYAEEEWKKIWPDIWKVCEWEIERYAEGGAEEELMDSSYEAGWWLSKKFISSLREKKEK